MTKKEQREVVSKIAQALVHEYRQCDTSDAQVAIVNAACELNVHFPGVHVEFECMLSLI